MDQKNQATTSTHGTELCIITIIPVIFGHFQDHASVYGAFFKPNRQSRTTSNHHQGQLPLTLKKFTKKLQNVQNFRLVSLNDKTFIK
jgi:hypothetical protein